MRRYLTVPLYVLMVFLSGVLVGSVGHRLLVAKPVNAGPRPKPEDFRRNYIERMRTRLHLSDDQLAQLKDALQKTDQRMADFDQRFKAERKALWDEHVQRINAFLDDQQRAEYQKLRQEHEQQRKARDKGRHGPKSDGP
jgi:septal ring factor EnvC (AmiA/AmiB activator)